MGKEKCFLNYYYEVNVFGKYQDCWGKIIDFIDKVNGSAITDAVFFKNGFHFVIFRDVEQECNFEDYLFNDRFLIDLCKKKKLIIEVIGRDYENDYEMHKWEYYCIDKNFVKQKKSYCKESPIDFFYELKGEPSDYPYK